jgi:hypothetical protein
MRILSRELISALRSSFEAWPDVAARLAACIVVRLRWNAIRSLSSENRSFRGFWRTLLPKWHAILPIWEFSDL